MRIFSAVSAAFITGLPVYFTGLAAAPKSALYLFLFSWAVFAFLFYRGAKSTGAVWGRACLAAGLECLAVSVASRMPWPGNLQAIQAAKQGTYAGQAFGSAVGAGVISVLAGYTGLFIGLVLLATAYCSLRPARRKR